MAEVTVDDPAGMADPLERGGHSPVKNVIRVYPDRIAFCVNNECALYCRFCRRKRMVKGREGDHVVVETWDRRLWRELNPAR
jgi:lysine 2,3-aminomutase